MLRLIVAGATALTATSVALADDVLGDWMRADGKMKIRFDPCDGGAICGVVTWLSDADGPAKIGQRVFYDIHANGEGGWAGRAFNPADGWEYAGRVSLVDRTLTTTGCVLGGLVCKGFDWTRVQ
jgi:uncharacterized protein (DUF2147 family)